ncbi:hypothetical protein V8F20_000439 [Naviculisporaceae sp. PSN 640]
MSTSGDAGPGASSSSVNPDLETFREQWRAEVRARHPTTAGPSNQPQQQSQQTTQHHHHHHHRAAPSVSATAGGATSNPPVHMGGHPRSQPPPPMYKPPVLKDYEDDYVQPRSFDEPEAAVSAAGDGEAGSASAASKEPVSALDHYEKAVEREAAGSLGDSLKLYRKAFRMDDRVDQQYKNKHFPKAAAKATAATGLGDPAAGGADATPGAPAKKLTMKELILSFANLAIEPAQPEIEGMPEPPCPIAALPDEIMVHILRDVAILDVGDYVRLARVCERFAFLVATEDRIWRRICLGEEWGFGGMHYHWQLGISGEPLTGEDLIREAEAEAEARSQAREEARASGAETAESDSDSEEDLDDDALQILTLGERSEKHAQERTATTMSLFRSSVYNSSWQRMFRLRPRIRFGGCYISTVNYIRPGQAATTQYTWASPVHIVTYYRYLRFFRDGSVLSLLTTNEPVDVVHHMTKEKAALHVKGANPHLPSSVMTSVLKGRWKLVEADQSTIAPSSSSGSKISPTDIEGDVVVETEGVMPKYIYRMDLSLRSSGGGKGSVGLPRNNKLVWRGFYSYDRLTDDWAEFTLKNYKPFFYSRVRSYGAMGE